MLQGMSQLEVPLDGIQTSSWILAATMSALRLANKRDPACMHPKPKSLRICVGHDVSCQVMWHDFAEALVVSLRWTPHPVIVI